MVAALKRVEFQGQEGSDRTIPKLQRHCTSGEIILLPLCKDSKESS